MNNYKNIMDMVTSEYNQNRADFLRYLEEREDVLKRNLTPARLAKYEAGKLSREDAIKAAFDRGRKQYDKWEDEAVLKLEEASEAADVVSVSVSVEWHRSRTWGYNPAAEVVIVDSNGHYYKYFGSASGCGYDKESAAVAEALNKSASIKKMLYDKKEAAIKAGASYNNGSTMNNNFIHYGAGYGSVPYFEAGVGMSSHRGIFEACGLALKNSNHGKAFDTYYFER